MADRYRDRDESKDRELEELLEGEGGEGLPEENDGESPREVKAGLVPWVLFLILPCYALDQIVKTIIVKKAELGIPYNVIPGFFDILHVRNTGAAFGMLQNIPVQVRTYFFLGVTVVAFVAMFVIFMRAKERSRLISLVFSLVIAGALGNLTDRFLYGEVVDFLSVYIGTFRWPTFNLADTYITLGMLGLLFHILTMPREED